MKFGRRALAIGKPQYRRSIAMKLSPRHTPLQMGLGEAAHNLQ